MCNILVGLGFPLLDAGLGPLAFAPFGAVLAAGLAFVVLGLPETLNSTENDIKYQVKPHHYSFVMIALMDALRRSVDTGFTTLVKNSWIGVLSIAMKTMVSTAVRHEYKSQNLEFNV